jgi:hypothetical protein
MDVALSEAHELVATLSLSGNTAPHKVAEALSVLLRPLPLDVRARAACVCRAWRAATANPELWEELSFERCAARVSDETLASLCARAGAALRTLRLDADTCWAVTGDGMLAALRNGGCTGVRCLNRPATVDHETEHMFTLESAQQLAAVCPMLEHAACVVRCYLRDTPAALAALPGPLGLKCASSAHNRNEDSEADLTRLSLATNASTAASICSRLASRSSSVAKPSSVQSFATSCASCAAFCSGLLAYLLFPMHSATCVSPSLAGLTYIPRLAIVLRAQEPVMARTPNALYFAGRPATL